MDEKRRPLDAEIQMVGRSVKLRTNQFGYFHRILLPGAYMLNVRFSKKNFNYVKNVACEIFQLTVTKFKNHFLIPFVIEKSNLMTELEIVTKDNGNYKATIVSSKKNNTSEDLVTTTNSNSWNTSTEVKHVDHVLPIGTVFQKSSAANLVFNCFWWIFVSWLLFLCRCWIVV